MSDDGTAPIGIEARFTRLRHLLCNELSPDSGAGLTASRSTGGYGTACLAAWTKAEMAMGRAFFRFIRALTGCQSL